MAWSLPSTCSCSDAGGGHREQGQCDEWLPQTQCGQIAHESPQSMIPTASETRLSHGMASNAPGTRRPGRRWRWRTSSSAPSPAASNTARTEKLVTP